MNTQKYIIASVTALIIAGGSFYGGMAYARERAPRLSQTNFRNNLQNLSPEERQARLQQFGAMGGGRGGMMRQNGGFSAGSIIAKDDKSITVKLRDGGSKIIFLSEKTSVTKSAQGSINDLAVGTEITTSGTPNQDGSITADTIQIRPPGQINR